MSNSSEPRQQLIDICSNVLANKISLLEASRLIVALGFTNDLDENDDDINSFVAIESETDHLPIGRVRQYWNETSLKEKDLEIEENEKWARSFGIESCENIIQKYKKDV